MPRPGSYDATPYALRLSKITEKYLVLIGVFICICVVSMGLSAIGFFIVIEAKSGIDQTKQQMCAGFEDVVEKALTPLKAPKDASLAVVQSYQNANAQKLLRIKDIKGELAAHSSCTVSINK